MKIEALLRMRSNGAFLLARTKVLKKPTMYNRSMSSNQPRLVAPPRRTDDKLDPSLRPRSLNELIGQANVRENLAILIAAAQQRGEALDHVLFYGPPRLGKTTLAHILPNQMSVHIKVTSGPAI